MALTDKLTNIADAIRGKTGKTEEMTLDQMPLEIAGIVSGGGGGQYETGEIIGDGVVHNGTPIQIPVSFEPDILFMCLTDASTTLDANHVIGGCLIRDTFHQASHRAANSANISNGGFGYWIDGFTGHAINNRASYENGMVSWWLSPGGRPLHSGASYTWFARKW